MSEADDFLKREKVVSVAMTTRESCRRNHFDGESCRGGYFLGKNESKRVILT